MKKLENGFFNIGYKIILMVIAGVIIGNILLLLAFTIPVDKMERNAREAAEVFGEETMDAVVKLNLLGAKLDNYTDSIMLGSAAYNGSEPILQKIVRIYHKEYENKTPFDSFITYYSGEKGGNAVEYSRYWHGYLTILKPMLYFFNYTQIRIINVFVQGLLLIAVVMLLWKRNLKKYIFPFLIMILFLDPATVPCSLQFSAVYYIFMAAAIILLWKHEKIQHGNRRYFFFCLLGMITSYMDFLTYPIITLGVPICIYCILDKRKNQSEIIKDILFLSIAWGVGYAGMWAGKWISGSIILQENVFIGAFAAIEERAGHRQDEIMISYMDVLRRNLSMIVKINGISICAAGILGSLISGIWGNVFSVRQLQWKKAMPFLLISLIPFAWYMGTSNHAYIHFWFTFRNLAVSALAGQCFLLKLLSREELKQ